jgi:hypothetical protein
MHDQEQEYHHLRQNRSDDSLEEATISSYAEGISIGFQI